MQLGDVKKLLKGTEYEASSDCIAGTFERYGIKTITDLENTPAMFGTSLCRNSIWELIAFIRDRVMNPVPEPEPEPEAVEEAPTPRKRMKRAANKEEEPTIEEKPQEVADENQVEE